MAGPPPLNVSDPDPRNPGPPVSVLVQVAELVPVPDANCRSSPARLAGSWPATATPGKRFTNMATAKLERSKRRSRSFRSSESFFAPVSYTHLRAHETRHDLVC